MFPVIALFSQEVVNDSTENNEDDYSYLLLKSEEVEKDAVYKPVLGFGNGVITYLGDVNDVYRKHPTFGRIATSAYISRKFTSFIDLNFYMIYGKLSGNQRTSITNFNFQTEMLDLGLKVKYNFEHLFKTPQGLQPFVSVGLETYEFNSKTDLTDGEGNIYNYWSDGTIRNVAETPGASENSIILQRDYIYETDVRELNKLNKEGLGDYPLVAFSIPVEIGAELFLSDRLSMRLGISYHYSFNDLIDGATPDALKERPGEKGTDKFMFSYVSIHYDFFSPPKQTVLDEHYSDVDFSMIELADTDNDKIRDWDDRCPETPIDVKVDSKGCPLDDDIDGIPNYADKELNSAPKAIVGLDGVTLTDEQILAMSTPKEAIASADICKHYPSMCWGVRKFRRYYLDIPQKFKKVDENNDGYISLQEINDAIDKFFDLGSDLTIDDIYELNDFFFEQ